MVVLLKVYKSCKIGLIIRLNFNLMVKSDTLIAHLYARKDRTWQHKTCRHATTCSLTHSPNHPPTHSLHTHMHTHPPTHSPTLANHSPLQSPRWSGTPSFLKATHRAVHGTDSYVFFNSTKALYSIAFSVSSLILNCFDILLFNYSPNMYKIVYKILQMFRYKELDCMRFILTTLNLSFILISS